MKLKGLIHIRPVINSSAWQESFLYRLSKPIKIIIKLSYEIF